MYYKRLEKLNLGRFNRGLFRFENRRNGIITICY